MKSTSVVEASKKAFAFLTDWATRGKAGIGAVVEAHQALLAARAEKAARRVAITVAVAPKAERKASARALIDAVAASVDLGFNPSLGRALSGAVRDPLEGGPPELVPPTWPDFLASNPGFAFLCWISPEIVQRGIERRIDADTSEEGLPMQNRSAVLESLAEEIAGIDRELVKLSDQARDAGIEIPLPNAEAARRLQVVQKHDRWQTDEYLTKTLRGDLPHVPLPEPPRE